MSSKALQRAKLAELRALRKAGKKVFDTYQVQDADSLYEEVDEARYKKIIRDRLDQDDFVVDDNGEGYADDGREEWDRVPVYETDSEDDKVIRGRPSKTGTAISLTCPVLLVAPPNMPQARNRRRMNKPGEMRTIGTLANTSPRAPRRPRRRQRSVPPKCNQSPNYSD
jgi:hypothetical protein